MEKNYPEMPKTIALIAQKVGTGALVIAKRQRNIEIFRLL